MKIINRILSRFKLKRSGINIKDFKQLVDITKKLENINIKDSSFNIDDIRIKYASNN